jgi:hypothetical protein
MVILRASKDSGSWQNSSGKHNCLVCLWVLADSLLIRHLQNDAVHRLYQVHSECNVARLDLFDVIYENTPKGLPLRAYHTNLCISRSSEATFTNLGPFPKQFLLDIVVAYAKLPRTRRDSLVELAANIAQYEVPVDKSGMEHTFTFQCAYEKGTLRPALKVTSIKPVKLKLVMLCW